MKPVHLFGLILSLALSACASAPQTRAILDDPGPIQPTHQIQNVPFIAQTENYCGPATLGMVAEYAGVTTPIETLGNMMFTPGKKGTLPTDYLGAARRVGLTAVALYSLKALLTEVSANHPVVVLENLGSKANPIWHYAVLFGYDLKDETLTFHSGADQNFKLQFSDFERVWRAADYWALTVVRAGTVIESATLLENLNAATALERVNKTKEANLAYQAIAQHWPNEPAAYFGLGNTYATLHQYQSSAKAFEKSAELSPDVGAIWNNLGEVYLKLHQKKRASHAFKMAKNLTTMSKSKDEN